MSDLISRNLLIKVLTDAYFYSETLEMGEIKTIIENAPTVPLPDFKEGYKQAILDGKTNFSRPQGKWKRIIDEYNDVECPFCGFQEDGIYYNFCPCCGADMMKGSVE